MSSPEEILEVLPHRYPMLLVDKIVEIEPKEKIVAVKNVTFNENFFQGHYPEKPIMPGVLIIEAMAQASGCLLLKSIEKEEKEMYYFAGIDKAKFRKTVIPGDQITLKCEVLKFKKRVAKVKGEAYVGDDLVAESRLLFAMK
ncbi:MAG TPA: 3-hydroxyacyl-ACP dehydratase FabZ [Halanaerobiales bacterium]|nr:3-hydroxyacyl-ACP dehydratase FabZ [Halanaerobiales bacterium]